MAVQLQLNNDEIKNYKTWYRKSKGDSSIYVTKCGMQCEEEPDKSIGCNHLDCAIAAIQSTPADGFAIAGIFTILTLITLYIGIKGNMGSIWVITTVVLGVYMIVFALWNSFIDERCRKDLIEFRDHGTIKGTNARKI